MGLLGDLGSVTVRPAAGLLAAAVTPIASAGRRVLAPVDAVTRPLAAPLGRILEPAVAPVAGLVEPVLGPLRATAAHPRRSIATLLDLPHRHRRVWLTHGRAHVELREVPEEDTPDFVAHLERTLAAHPGIHWAEVLTRPGRVVVAHDPDVVGAVELLDLVERLEAEAEVAHHPLGVDRPDHPADPEPVLIAGVAMLADAVGLVTALGFRAVRRPALPLELDTAALLAVLDNVPVLRSRIDRRLSHPVAELALAVGNGIAAGLTQGALGPLVDVAHRATLVLEAEARRLAWEDRERELCASPSDHPRRSLTPRTREVPLADGPVERFGERGWTASLGGFGVGLGLTRSMERAAAALIAGLPKAARLGRDVYAAHVVRLLAERGAVVFDPGALRLLDRIDVLMLDPDLFPTAAGVDERVGDLVALARSADLRVVVVRDDDPGPGPEPNPWDADAVIRRSEWADAVRKEQFDRHGVLVVATGTEEALELADLGVGLTVAGHPPPWGAHLLARGDLAEVWLVIEAVRAAREVSRQSARLATFGAGAATFLAFGGAAPGTLQRVTSAVNIATVLAMANATRTALQLRGVRPPLRRSEVPWHSLGVAEAMARLGSGRRGLSAEEAARRHVPPPEPDPTPVRFARALTDEMLNPLTPVLAAGAGLSLATGSVADAAMVTVVIGINGLVGAAQRIRTEAALDALMHQEERQVTVRRDGRSVTVRSSEVVVGDLIVLEAGDIVPADGRLIESAALQMDESGLTGESLPTTKSPDPVEADIVAERSSMVYDGTSVAAGSAVALAVAVGDETEARRSVRLASDAAPPSGVEARLSDLTTRFLPISVGAGLGIVGLGLLRGRGLIETAGAGVSLAVAAVPEGLPILATVAQLSAARRLARRGALVRNPRSIEALGRVDVLCADKTGTLTEGHVTVQVVSDGTTSAEPPAVGGRTAEVLAAAGRATPRPDGDGPLPHPTDRAVRRALVDAGLDDHEDENGWSRLDELPFEPERALHATLLQRDDTLLLTVKGAPETVLPRCTHRRTARGRPVLGTAARARIEAMVEDLAERGLRVLAVAERRLSEAPAAAAPGAHPVETVLEELTFLGLLGLADPPRQTAAEAVRGVSAAGVEVMMITGDHPSTARGVAAAIGLSDGEVIVGPEIDRLDDDELAERLERTSVCARVTPAHKVRIVRALQRAGHVVAMTGDGANDAPAIRLAHVGVALGSRATTAAREAADLVVVDDRIETIVDAIGEGRTMWSSVRDAVAVLAGGNLGEILFTVGGSLLSGTSPLNARQLLLVNLLTDVAPALAIAVRPPAERTIASLLEEGPDRSLGEALDDAIAVRAMATAAGTGVAWSLARLTGTPQRASTVALIALVGTQLGQTLAAGGRSPAVTASGVGSMALMGALIQTPGVSQLLGCRPVGPVGWAIGLGAAGAGTVGAMVLPRLGVGMPDWARVLTSSGPAPLDPDQAIDPDQHGGIQP
jgi:calcium-translocating P-type ATPase